MVWVLKHFCVVGQGHSPRIWLIPCSVRRTNRQSAGTSPEPTCGDFVCIYFSRKWQIFQCLLVSSQCSSGILCPIQMFLKMLFLISWELRKQTASELWRLQGNFYSVKSLVLKGIFLNALCVLCTSFKGARARKENTHANIALVRGNCSTFLVLILKVKTIACHNDAIFWLKANGLVWDEGHLEGLLLLVKGGGESGGKSLPCNCFSSLRKLAVSETR